MYITFTKLTHLITIFSIYVGGRTRINSRCYISSIVTTGWQRLEIFSRQRLFILILFDTIDYPIRIMSLASRHFAWVHRCPGVWLLTRPLVWPRIVTACCKSSSEFRGQLTSDCCRRISRKVIHTYIYKYIYIFNRLRLRGVLILNSCSVIRCSKT